MAVVRSCALAEPTDLIRKRPELRYWVGGYWNIQQFLEGRTTAEKQKLEKMPAKRNDLADVSVEVFSDSRRE